MSRKPVFISQGQLETTNRCPTCDELLDGFTHLASGPEGAAVPTPGDLTVCAYCSSVLAITLGPRGLLLRPATDVERAGAVGPMSLPQIEELTREFRRRRDN